MSAQYQRVSGRSQCSPVAVMQRWVFPRGVLSTLLALTAVLAARTSLFAQADETSRAWNQPVPPFRLFGNIYYVGVAEITSFLITTPAGHILLDGGFAETPPIIERNIAQLGFRLADVKILLNSQAHRDHAGGFAELKEKTGATLMVMRGDAELVARGGKDDFAFRDSLTYPPVTADRVLSDGDKAELGGVTMTAHSTPGHTRGCTTWTMEVTEGGKTCAVVFVGSASIPGYKLRDNDRYPEIINDYERTFAALKKLPCDIFLGSHGSFFELKEKSERLARGETPNPFIDPSGYRSYVDDAERSFRAQLERESAAH